MTALARSLIVAAVILTAIGAAERTFGGQAPKQAAKPSKAPSAKRLDAESLLAKLKEMDARYESGFAAAGRFGNKKWQITMGDGKLACEEEVIEVTKPPARPPRPGRRAGGLAPYGSGGFMVLRRTMFVGPRYYALYNWVGRRPPIGPVAPWPDGERGPATAGNLTIYSLDDPAHSWYIRRRVQILGRGYSRHIDKITALHHREDGLTSFTADGTTHRSKNYVHEAKWACLVDPRAAYMIRSAVIKSRVFNETRVMSGLKWDGPLCVPTTIGGTTHGSVASVSSKTDLEFLEKIEATLHGPYLIHTDFDDERDKDNTYKSIKAGGTWTEE